MIGSDTGRESIENAAERIIHGALYRTTAI